jgi:hypothetical protein
MLSVTLSVFSESSAIAVIISNTCFRLGETYSEDLPKAPTCISKSLPLSEGYYVPLTDVIGPCQRGK